MTRRAEIRQSDATRIAKAAAQANVKAEIKLPSGATVIFSPHEPDPQKQAPSKRVFVL